MTEEFCRCERRLTRELLEKLKLKKFCTVCGGNLPWYKLTSPLSNGKITETEATNAIYENLGQDDSEDRENSENPGSAPDHYQEIDSPTRIEDVTGNIRDEIRLIANGIYIFVILKKREELELSRHSWQHENDSIAKIYDSMLIDDPLIDWALFILTCIL